MLKNLWLFTYYFVHSRNVRLRAVSEPKWSPQIHTIHSNIKCAKEMVCKRKCGSASNGSYRCEQASQGAWESEMGRSLNYNVLGKRGIKGECKGANEWINRRASEGANYDVTNSGNEVGAARGREGERARGREGERARGREGERAREREMEGRGGGGRRRHCHSGGVCERKERQTHWVINIYILIHKLIPLYSGFIIDTFRKYLIFCVPRLWVFLAIFNVLSITNAYLYHCIPTERPLFNINCLQWNNNNTMATITKVRK